MPLVVGSLLLAGAEAAGFAGASAVGSSVIFGSFTVAEAVYGCNGRGQRRTALLRLPQGGFMTAIICIRKPDRIDVVTDGACIDSSGVLKMIASKVGLLAAAPALLAGRGNSSLIHALTGSCAASGWSFD